MREIALFIISCFKTHVGYLIPWDRQHNNIQVLGGESGLCWRHIRKVTQDGWGIPRAILAGYGHTTAYRSWVNSPRPPRHFPTPAPYHNTDALWMLKTFLHDMKGRIWGEANTGSCSRRREACLARRRTYGKGTKHTLDLVHLIPLCVKDTFGSKAKKYNFDYYCFQTCRDSSK